MKNTLKAAIGSLPSTLKVTRPVNSISMAASGEDAMRMIAEGSARLSKRSGHVQCRSGGAVPLEGRMAHGPHRCGRVEYAGHRQADRFNGPLRARHCGG